MLELKENSVACIFFSNHDSARHDGAHIEDLVEHRVVFRAQGYLFIGFVPELFVTENESNCLHLFLES